MSYQQFTLSLSDADNTARIAAELGKCLTSGDTILLTGDVGAGKTHFARALIQSLLLYPEDVPSPTFTLVQTYDTAKGPVWHADLYRLGSSHEIEELGLVDAFETAICLVEWPDRLGPMRPQAALDLRFETTGEDTRTLTAHWEDDSWRTRIEGLQE